LYSKLKKVLASPFNVVLLTHVNPDGDAIGSVLGLYWFLVKKGCNVSMATPNDFPHFLKWMDGADEIMNHKTRSEKVESMLKEADLVFYLDFNEPERLAGMKESLKYVDALSILVDHHPDPVEFADHIISDTGASSTAELIYQLICDMDGESLVDSRIAECLYTGIMTDTGCFSFNSSNPETFGRVAELLQKGIDKDRIFSLVYDNYSEDRMKLLGLSLKDKMVVLPELRTAYISLTDEELSRFSHRSGDTEGFVNYPFMIRDVRVTALFLDRKDHIKISFRSKGAFKINCIAQQHFSGGGHLNAAGGESTESMEATISRFEEVIRQHADEIRRLP
jgi:phosphoesterase RecJ-like protein